MVNLRKTVTDRQAAEAKTLLWQGVGQGKVALLVGISQSTVSRLKDGTAGAEALWPNGMAGAMPNRTMALEEGWSDEASDFMKMPEEMQNRILQIVNEVREAAGDLPIPHTAPEYEAMLRMDATDRAFEQISIAESRLAEDRRMATCMIQFNEIIAERRAAQDDKVINRIIDSTLSHDIETPPLEDKEYIATINYTKMPWETVCIKAYKVKIVKLAMIGERVALREACCILFQALKGSRQSWNDDAVADLIYRLADKLEANEERMKLITEEYSDG